MSNRLRLPDPQPIPRMLGCWRLLPRRLRHRTPMPGRLLLPQRHGRTHMLGTRPALRTAVDGPHMVHSRDILPVRKRHAAMRPW